MAANWNKWGAQLPKAPRHWGNYTAMQRRLADSPAPFSIQLHCTRLPLPPPSRLGQTPQTGSEAPRNFLSPLKWASCSQIELWEALLKYWLLFWHLYLPTASGVFGKILYTNWQTQSVITAHLFSTQPQGTGRHKHILIEYIECVFF